ncbi:MAG: MaoC/PaaZ C-terminal domain-containing protein [Actinomycetota bacterium]|nr:MaoC/PaaZ C-terminal domain-containing protein [Actinomycetota bacterium]
MPIDIDQVLGAELPGGSFSWTDDDIILYNLGVGAGNPPTDELELKYSYEGDLQAIPSYGTIPPFGIMMSLGAIEGLDISLAQILHGEQELIVHRPIPTTGSVTQTGRIIDVFDKGKGALVVMEIVSVDDKTGDPLFTNRSSIFIRGEGGFGGESGPSAGNEAPEREPDHLVESATLPQQALLYRLASGDKNPLHADPGFAMFAGFERPILHGLCTYGIAAKAVVDAALDGKPELVEDYKARFTGHVFPGETLVTAIWEEDDGLILRTTTKERGTTVLANAAVRTRAS